jgi:hypothetical protein
MDEYNIALSPDLGITPEEFANAWNETDVARTIAEARLSQAKGIQFLDPMMVTVLISVSTGVASNLLTDIIEGIIQQLRSKKGAQSKRNKNSNGTLRTISPSLLPIKFAPSTPLPASPPMASTSSNRSLGMQRSMLNIRPF